MSSTPGASSESCTYDMSFPTLRQIVTPAYVVGSTLLLLLHRGFCPPGVCDSRSPRLPPSTRFDGEGAGFALDLPASQIEVEASPAQEEIEMSISSCVGDLTSNLGCGVFTRMMPGMKSGSFEAEARYAISLR